MSETAIHTINVGIVGAGTVGRGALQVLVQNAELIARRALPLRVAWVAEQDQDKARGLLDELGLTATKVTGDWQEIIADPDTQIVVELIGGTTLARDIIAAALEAGKSAVTANKDLMAAYGGELLAIAEAHQADLFFEASVGGGIPVIQSMKENLAGNRFLEIKGIVNGTTNYILTKMTESGADFAETLAEAQALGYAEADPTADVAGLDAARKMAILASIAFNSRVTYDMVATEGITKISAWDVLYAREFGYVIKMLGLASSDGDSIEVRVHPLMIPKTHPLAAVRDTYNAIFITGDAVENTMLYGRGAGSLPTGSAVVGDIIQAARNIAHDCRARWGCTCFKDLPIKPLDDTVSKYYVRVSVQDKVGVFAALSSALSAANVSMDAVMQKRRLPDGGAEIVMITHLVRHKDMMTALSIIDRLDCVTEVSEFIRVED